MTRKKRKEITEILPIQLYDDESNCFQLQNHIFMDFIQISTSDMQGASEDELEFDIMHFERFFKLYDGTLKLIALNFPTDTKIQQQYIRHKITTTHNTVYKHELQRKLEELELIEKKRTDRVFYLMIFSDSTEQLENRRSTILKSLQGYVFPISFNKKIQILYKLNNKSSSIFV